jgi:hypothetical protein
VARTFQRSRDDAQFRTQRLYQNGEDFEPATGMGRFQTIGLESNARNISYRIALPIARKCWESRIDSYNFGISDA